MAKNQFRHFSKFFTNLSPLAQQELQRLLYDAEQSLEGRSVATNLQVLQRDPSEFNLTVEGVAVSVFVGGAEITWFPLDDDKVVFYEIELGDTEVFATSELYTTFTANFIVQNPGLLDWARVRAVRTDGSTSLWSEAVQLPTIPAPSTSDIIFHEQSEAGLDFWVSGADPVADVDLVSITYTPTDINGVSIIIGQVYGALYNAPVALFSPLYLQTETSGPTITDIDASDPLAQRSTLNKHLYGFGPTIVTHPASGTLEVRIRAKGGRPLAEVEGRRESANLKIIELAF